MQRAGCTALQTALHAPDYVRLAASCQVVYSLAAFLLATLSHPVPAPLTSPPWQATHIFDGLEDWPSHLMYVAGGRLQVFAAAAEVPELRQGQLLLLVERWLREEQAQRRQAKKLELEAAAAEGAGAGADQGEQLHLAAWNNGYASGRLASSIKLSSNAVLRM